MRPPSQRPGRPPLAPRDREILRDVIYTFIVSGDPVSSRSVAKQERHGLSSASIRNVMADLEEHGFVSSPHTSAGRVPTDKGYRYFVDALLRFQPPEQSELAELKRHLDPRTADSKALEVLELGDQLHSIIGDPGPGEGKVLERHVGQVGQACIGHLALDEQEEFQFHALHAPQPGVRHVEVSELESLQPRE